MDNSEQIISSTSNQSSIGSNVTNTSNTPANNQSSSLDDEQKSIRPSKLDQ